MGSFDFFDPTGTSFWSASWFLNLLYQIDTSGQVVSVYDLPRPANLSRPVAITFDGGIFWYVVTDLAGSEWLYRFH